MRVSDIGEASRCLFPWKSTPPLFVESKGVENSLPLVSMNERFVKTTLSMSHLIVYADRTRELGRSMVVSTQQNQKLEGRTLHEIARDMDAHHFTLYILYF